MAKSSRGGKRASSGGKQYTKEEMIEAVKYFTSDGHTAIRRGKDEESREAIEQYISQNEPYKDWITSKSEIYRGINLSEHDGEKFLQRLSEGSIIDMGGISSWTSDIDVAKNFSNNGHLEYKVMFTVKQNKTGVSIQHLSYEPFEREVIVSSKVRYKVNKVKVVDQSSQYFGVNKYINVELEEV